MALFIHLSNLVINKTKLDEHQLITLKKSLNFGSSERDQEDEHILSVAAMNPDEHDESPLEVAKIKREHYAYVYRYGGIEGEVSWLKADTSCSFCWHEADDLHLAPKIKIIDTMPYDDFFEKYKNFEGFLKQELQ